MLHKITGNEYTLSTALSDVALGWTDRKRSASGFVVLRKQLCVGEILIPSLIYTGRKANEKR